MKKIRTASLVASLATVAAVVAAPLAAHADSILGVQLQLLPGGEGEFDADVPIIDVEGTADLETAYALAVVGEYVVHRNVTVGLAPRFIFNVKTEDADDAGSQLDIPVRVTGRLFFGNKLAIHGYLAPGYSVIFPPDDDIDSPTGFIFGLGTGVAYQVGSNLAISGELGYTAGYHSVEVNNPVGDDTVTFSTSYPHLAIGLQTAF